MLRSAAGFGLIAAHDYRVMSANKGFAAMNEIDLCVSCPCSVLAELMADTGATAAEHRCRRVCTPRLQPR